MIVRSEAYRLLQQRTEQDLAPLLQRGYRVLESACSDTPTGVGITLCRERVCVSVSFDLRDRIGDLYVAKISADRSVCPNWHILTYLERLCGFRGEVSQGLSPERRASMGNGELMANDIGVLAKALFKFAPRIADDTEDFVGAMLE